MNPSAAADPGQRLRVVGMYREFAKYRGGEEPDDSTPSIYDAIRDAGDDGEDRLLRYLESGHVLIGVLDVVPDILDPARGCIGHSSVYTDGLWVWPEYLAYYVRNYHLRLDDTFLHHVNERKGIMVNESEVDWERLMKATAPE